VRLLVTGGAGFIGSNFVMRILSNYPGYEVTVLDAFTYAANRRNLERAVRDISLVEGNICESGLVDEVVSQVDAVIHFAAETHNDNSIKNPEIFFSTNVTGTLNLANSCARHDVRLHHISTDEVYGDLPIDSDDQFSLATPYNPSSPYSASKAASDHIVRSWVRTFGLRATISNCSNNYGPNQHFEKLITAKIRRVMMGEKPKVYGTGLNVRDWIHVDDHSDGVMLALTNGKLGASYLFGARNRLSNLEVVSRILEIMGKPADYVEFVPDRPGHDAKYAIDPSFAEQELGWRPAHTNLLENLPNLVEHYTSTTDGY